MLSESLSVPLMLEADQIEQIIPHRYPFLFVDRIIEVEDGQRAVGIKNVTANEWFFEGHFPGRKVMPGVLIVEALAQVAAVALLKNVEMAGKSPLSSRSRRCAGRWGRAT